MNLKTGRHALALMAFVLTFGLGRAHAGITFATLSNFVIPSETINTPASPSATTVQIRLDAGGNIELDIFRLQNVTDQPTAANQVAGIQLNGALASPPDFFIPWNGLWPIGGAQGRQDGLFQFIVNYTPPGGTTPTPFVIPTLLQITSVDIHSLSVTPSFDANHIPSLPYIIAYALAKNSLVTVRVKNSAGSVIRTLVSNAPQFGESVSPNTLSWDGLNDAGRPVALGVYTVTVDAKDPTSADTATTQSQTAAVTSLANLNADSKQLFETNALVYPNPVRGGQATIQALAIRENTTISIKIYTIAGDLVRSETFPGLTTANLVNFNWDATNQAGKKLGRGLYYIVFREQDDAGMLQTVKKIAVIP